MPKRAAALALLAVVCSLPDARLEAAPPPQSAAAASQGAGAAGALYRRRRGVAWAGFDATTFAKAKAEGRFVILDGAAEWCHFCHVMEEKTYAIRESKRSSQTLHRRQGRHRPAPRHRRTLRRLGMAGDDHLLSGRR
ncbi:MAG: DUF255 domain-containing protein [Polyangiaceae bacterium]